MTGINTEINLKMVEAPDYCGFLQVDKSSETTIYRFHFYTKDNLNDRRTIMISIKNRDVNDVYKIINSIEVIK